MTDATHDAPELEMQILTAHDGTAYLLPRALAEAARLTPEDAASLRAQAGADDVHGHTYRVRFGPSAGAGLGHGALAQQILAGNSLLLAALLDPTLRPPDPLPITGTVIVGEISQPTRPPMR